MGRLFLYLLGLIWIVEGALLIFAPDILREKLFNKLKNIPLKKLGMFPILVGILLLLSVSRHRSALFITILGLLELTKGMFVIVSPEKAKKVKDWWIGKASDTIYRIFGVIAIILGSFVLIGI